MTTDNLLKFIDFTPKYEGWYESGGLRIFMLKKPLWIHRITMRVFFGWKWIDQA